MPDVLQILHNFNGNNIFSIDGNGNIILTDAAGGNHIGSQLNTHSMNQQDMFERYFSDIVKDSQADFKLTNVIQILRQCFPNHVASIPHNIAGYKVLLERFNNRVFTDNTEHITLLQNILKTSTVGSNIKISDALWALYESGFGCSSVCRNPGMKTVKTSAATLDSLLKQAYDYLFNPNVTFGSIFSARLGIPDGFTWRTRPATAADEHDWQQKSVVNIQFWNPPRGAAAADAVRGGIIDNQANIPAARGNFNGIGNGNNGDIMGNDPKNRMIDSFDVPIAGDRIPRVKRLFIIKEIGDVLQVWMYLALIHMMGYDAVDVVMVTTDSVVFLFCILLGLSCIYTGERAGVRPGCCTLRHYLAGRPNYLKKYENMIEVYATRLIQHNTSISMGLLGLIAVPSNFDYYIEHAGNPGYRRTIASKGLTSNIRSTQVNPLIRRFIKIIDTSTERVKLALKLVKTDIAVEQGLPNAAIQSQHARHELQIALQETHENAIQLDITDIPDVQAAVAQVRAAAATALVSAAALLQLVILNTAAVVAAQRAIPAAPAVATQQQKAAAETTINDGYMHFCGVVDPLKQESMLTLLPNKRYIMLPGALLTAFVNFTNPPPGSVRVIPDVSRIIAGAAVAADVQRQFNQAIRGGGRGQRGGAPEKKQRVDPLGAPVAAAAPVAPVAAPVAPVAAAQVVPVAAHPGPPPPPPPVQDPITTEIANEDTSFYNECLVACYIQATRPMYNNLHLIPIPMTLKGHPECSIDYYDAIIRAQVVAQGGSFDFVTLYNEQIFQNNPAAHGWQVNQSYGNIYFEKQIAFALDYDKFANALIREQNLEFDETHGCHGRTPNRKLLEDYYDSLSSDQDPLKHISRSQILKRGTRLLRFLHLAEDITEEVSSLKSTRNERMKIFPNGSNDWIDDVDNRYSVYPNPLGRNDWIIDTTFHSWLLRNRHQNGNFNVPSFNPSTRCGGLRDPITYSLIDPALAIEITTTHPGVVPVIRKCYQITTIVDYLIKSNQTLDTLPDLSTQGIIPVVARQNIANFIIMMYSLTPEVRRKLDGFLEPPIILLLDRYNQEMALAARKRLRSGGTKRKTIKRKLHYKNKSKNQKIVNKHRMTRRNNIKTRRRTRKY